MKETIPAVFQECFLFRGLCKEEIAEAYLALSPRRIEFQKNECISGSGEERRELCILISGSVFVYRSREQRVLLRKIGAGGCFGAATLFSNDPHTPTEIVAAASGCLLTIDPDSLRSYFLRKPVSALNYISFLSDRIVFLNARVNDFSSSNAEEKTAKLLLSCASPAGIAEIPNLRAAAESMNLGRASLYRVLTAFSSRHWIEKDGKTIKLLDIEKLKGTVS